MTARRVTVAFEEVESAASRVVGQLSSPTFADGDLSGPPGRCGRYWCAADKPDAVDEHFRLAPVYRTQTVPDRARCETCAIRIRDLQAVLS